MVSSSLTPRACSQLSFFTAIKDGSAIQRLQSLPCRAPEVWQGLPCRHASDIWSFGVTVSAYIYVDLFERKLI